MSPLLRQYQRRLLKSMFHKISEKINVQNIDDCILLDNSAFVRITLNLTLK